MTDTQPYIGAMMSFLSKSGIRYTGILASIGVDECTIRLARVRCYGTEGRSDAHEVLGSDKQDDYTVFKMSDIKDLVVIDGSETTGGEEEQRQRDAEEPEPQRVAIIQPQGAQTNQPQRMQQQYLEPRQRVLQPEGEREWKKCICCDPPQPFCLHCRNHGHTGGQCEKATCKNCRLMTHIWGTQPPGRDCPFPWGICSNCRAGIHPRAECPRRDRYAKIRYTGRQVYQHEQRRIYQLWRDSGQTDVPINFQPWPLPNPWGELRVNPPRHRGDFGRDGGGGRYGAPRRTPYRLLVNNLSTRCSWQDLKDMMRMVGDVTYAEAHKRECPKNTGLVCFERHSDLLKAIDKYQGKDFNGRKMELVDDSYLTNKRWPPPSSRGSREDRSPPARKRSYRRSTSTASRSSRSSPKRRSLRHRSPSPGRRRSSSPSPKRGGREEGSGSSRSDRRERKRHYKRNGGSR